MSDAGVSSATAGRAAAVSAGAMLRRAREAQNMPIEALAAATKVVPRKLEALEADRHDQLPDATFARALAQAICRQLKIDPAPVLAQLPPLAVPHRLERVASGLNTPFRERPGRLVPHEWARSTLPVLGVGLAIAAVALAIYLFPTHGAGLLDGAARAGADRPAAAEGRTVVGVPLPVDATAGAASAGAVEPALAAAIESKPAAEMSAAAIPAQSTAAQVPDEAASAAAGWLQLRATTPSWVEVVDASGQSLISRVLQADESVAFDGAAPMRIKIGNARGTRLTLRGQPYELAAYTKDNVARLEVK